MTNPYTPEKVAELIAEARSFVRTTDSDYYENHLVRALADALTAVSADVEMWKQETDDAKAYAVLVEAERDAAIRDLDAGFAESDHLSAKYYQRMRDAERALSTLRDAVKDYDTNFPCDGGCNTNDGPAEECSRHGRSPSDLWERVERGYQAEAERDRLHKAITEALASEETTHEALCGRKPDGGDSSQTWRILRAALEQKGNDDE